MKRVLIFVVFGLAAVVVAAFAIGIATSAHSGHAKSVPVPTGTVSGVPGASGGLWICRYDYPDGGGEIAAVAVSSVSSCYRNAAQEIPGLPYSSWTYDADTNLPGEQVCDEDPNLYTVSDVTITITGNAPAGSTKAADYICGEIQGAADN